MPPPRRPSIGPAQMRPISNHFYVGAKCISRKALFHCHLRCLPFPLSRPSPSLLLSLLCVQYNSSFLSYRLQQHHQARIVLNYFARYTTTSPPSRRRRPNSGGHTHSAQKSPLFSKLNSSSAVNLEFCINEHHAVFKLRYHNNDRSPISYSHESGHDSTR